MYWKSGDYPELIPLPKAERNRIVAAAIKKSGSAISLRFIAAALACLSLPLVARTIEGLPTWAGVVAAVLGGLIFYCYLLLEINGPIRRAVKVFTGCT